MINIMSGVFCVPDTEHGIIQCVYSSVDTCSTCYPYFCHNDSARSKNPLSISEQSITSWQSNYHKSSFVFTYLASIPIRLLTYIPRSGKKLGLSVIKLLYLCFNSPESDPGIRLLPCEISKLFFTIGITSTSMKGVKHYA